ncbi:MAG: dihydrofolate reductase [Bacteroidetes Order II. Incertae sedis bacterium]|nr:dihydrofolate reductase [Bacteroidetes Order II. bacterium]
MNKARPELILIAAVADNLAIGRDLDLPWHIPADLRRFKAMTLGHPLLMGRITFDSLVHQFGHPLQGRPHLVVSHLPDLHYDFEEVHVFPTTEAALDAFKDHKRIFVSGGRSLYMELLTTCDRWEITHVHQSPEANVFFPEFRHLIGNLYVLEHEEKHDGFTFATYKRGVNSTR